MSEFLPSVLTEEPDKKPGLPHERMWDRPLDLRRGHVSDGSSTRLLGLFGLRTGSRQQRGQGCPLGNLD